MPQSPYATAPQPPGLEYATWSTRVIGYLIDSLLVGGGVLVLYLILGGVLGGIAAGLGELGGQLAGGACCLLLVLFPLASLAVGVWNRVYLVATRGYSVGQGVVKVKVVDAGGRRLTMGNAALRLLAQVGLNMIPLVGLLDLLWPLWDPTRQTLHDKAVGSYVVYNR